MIPGGAHTYAKGDDQYPEQSPAFIARVRVVTFGMSMAMSSLSMVWDCAR